MAETTQRIDPAIELSSPEGIRDPFPFYRRLRETTPVCWSETFGAWLVTGYDEVRDVYRDYERFTSVGTVNSNFHTLPPDVQAECDIVRVADHTSVLNTADPPEHTQHRAHILRPLKPRQMAARRDWVEAVCNELLAKLAESEPAEFIKQYSTPLSYTVILGLFGAPNDDVPLYERTTAARVRMDSRLGAGPEEAREYGAALRDFQRAMDRIFEEKRAHNDGSIIAALLHPEDGVEPLTYEQRFALVKTFFAAGHSNLIQVPARTLAALLDHPDQLELVREDPRMAAAAFEETARWDPTHHSNKRRVRVDTELCGQELRAGELIYNVKVSADRDPAVWSDPDRFDITRDQHEPHGGSLAFGQGVHFCAGAGVARMAGPLALATLLEQFPNVRTPEGWEPSWRPEPLNHYLTELPIHLQE